MIFGCFLYKQIIHVFFKKISSNSCTGLSLQHMPLILITAVLYKRPFKEIYSGALPAQPRSNNVVLRLERKRAKWATGIRRSATGRPFQAVGPATEKTRRCRITVRVWGTSNSAWAEERHLVTK